MIRVFRRCVGSLSTHITPTVAADATVEAPASVGPHSFEGPSPPHSGVSTACTSPRARRLAVCGFGSRKQQQHDLQEQLLHEQMQAALQQEEGVRDDDEVEAMGASVDYVGQTIESTKVKYRWLFRIAGVDHVVEFFNSKISGRKKLFMDKKLIYTQQQLRVNGFEYSWPCSGHLLSVIYDTRRQRFTMTVNGLPFHLFYRRCNLGYQRRATSEEQPSITIPYGASGLEQSFHQQQLYQQQRQLCQQQQRQLCTQQQQQQPYLSQKQGQMASATHCVRMSPPSSSQVPENVDLLDLVCSTGNPSSPCGITAVAGAETGGLSQKAPSSAVLGAPNSADAALAQLDGTFWSEPPATPESPAPGRRQGGASEGPLDASSHLPLSVHPSSFGGGYFQGPPTTIPQQESSNSGTTSCWEAPLEASSKPGSSKDEPLFADLMVLASEKLKISLSSKAQLRNTKSETG